MIVNRQRFLQWLPASFDGEFDWDFLFAAFYGTKIKPMDIDAVIERNGHFLIFETKAEGKGVDAGQRITLTRLWREGNKTIFLLMGKTPRTIAGYALYGEWEKRKDIEVGERPMVKANYLDVCWRCRQWFLWASGDKQENREAWETEIWRRDHAQSLDVAKVYCDQPKNRHVN